MVPARSIRAAGLAFLACALCGVAGCPFLTDTDRDGISDFSDVCPGSDDKQDADGDRVPDGCDRCPGFDDRIDTDGDGIPDGCATDGPGEEGNDLAGFTAAEEGSAVDLKDLVVDDKVVFSVPDFAGRPGETPAGKVRQAQVGACTCVWSVDPAAAGEFEPVDDCTSTYTVLETGEATISVAQTCNGDEVVLKQIIEAFPGGAGLPTAEAGPDQEVDERTLVTLDGSESFTPSGLPLTFSWIQLEGPDVDLSDANAEKPTFTPPPVGCPADNTVTLVFRLTVTEGENSDSHEVTITVENIDPCLPTARIRVSPSPGEAEQCETDTCVDEGTTVTLDGSRSTSAGIDEALSFQWAQIGQGPSVVLQNADQAIANFTAPSVDTDTVLDFELTASAGRLQDTAQVSVTVLDVPSVEGEIDPVCVSACGDGAVECAEQCDNGNQCDDRTTDCTEDATLCGNGSCAPRSGDGCSAACTDECGDGTQDTDSSDAAGYTEECDDGNGVDGDGCSSTCVLEGACCRLSGACDLRTQEACTAPDAYRGDGTPCEPDPCPTAPVGACCVPVTEECSAETEPDCFDFGRVYMGDNSDCADVTTCPECGNSQREFPPEQCDDGPGNNNDDCLDICRDASCGDGFVHNQESGTEVCDDGGECDNGDPCRIGGAPCGDASPCVPAIGDGCSSGCAVEVGWNCDDQEPTNCQPICGDGLVRGDEECDDRSQCDNGDPCSIGGAPCADALPCVPADGDGCSSVCVVEFGFVCNDQEPSVCVQATPITGNLLRGDDTAAATGRSITLQLQRDDGNGPVLDTFATDPDAGTYQLLVENSEFDGGPFTGHITVVDVNDVRSDPVDVPLQADVAVNQNLTVFYDFYVDDPSLDNTDFDGSQPLGTQDNPHTTIQPAFNVCLPGDRVVIKPGIYPELLEIDGDITTGTPGRPITIRSQDWVENAAHDRLLTVTVTADRSGTNKIHAVLVNDNQQHVVIAGLIMEAATSSNLIIANSDYITVKDCVMRNSIGNGLQVGSPFGGQRYIIFRRCLIYDNGNSGAQFRRQVVTVPGVRDSLIEDCDAFGNGFLVPENAEGFEVFGNGQGDDNNNIMFNRCLSYRNLSANFAHTDCINYTLHDSIAWDTSTFEEADGRSIAIGNGDGGTGAIVRRCVTFDAPFIGLMVSNAPQSTIYNNTIFDSGFVRPGETPPTGRLAGLSIGALDFLARNVCAFDNAFDFAGNPDSAARDFHLGAIPNFDSDYHLIKDGILLGNHGPNSITVDPADRVVLDQDLIAPARNLVVDKGLARELAENYANAAATGAATSAMRAQFFSDIADALRPAVGSPLIDNGGFLLVTTEARVANTVIPVHRDPRRFFRVGIPEIGVEGDEIQIDDEDSNPNTVIRVRITSMSDATITVAEPVTFGAGVGISIPYSGNRPDIGAFEFQE